MATNRNIYVRQHEGLNVPTREDSRRKSFIDQEIEQRVNDKVEELRLAFLNSKEGINYILHPNNVWISDALSEIKSDAERKLFIKKIGELQDLVRAGKNSQSKRVMKAGVVEERITESPKITETKSGTNLEDRNSKTEAMAAMQRIMQGVGSNTEQLLDDNNEFIAEEFSKLGSAKARKAFGTMLKTYQEAIGIQKRNKKISETNKAKEAKVVKVTESKKSIEEIGLKPKPKPEIVKKSVSPSVQKAKEPEKNVKEDVNRDDLLKGQELSAMFSWMSTVKPEKVATRIVDSKLKQLNLTQREMALALSKLRDLEKLRPGFLGRSFNKIAGFFSKNLSQDDSRTMEIDAKIAQAKSEYKVKFDLYEVEQKKAFALEIVVRTELLRRINEVAEQIDNCKKSMANIARTLDRKGKSRWEDAEYLRLFEELKANFSIYKGLYENLSVLDA